jgi:uncharacterized protein YutE (UPF0331/DUF86 family)
MEIKIENIRSGEILKRYVRSKRKINRFKNRNKIRNMAFNSLGVYVFGFQLLELTLQALEKFKNIISENPNTLEDIIKNNYVFILENSIKEDATINKDEKNFGNYIKKLEEKSIIDKNLFDKLDYAKNARNKIIHSSMVVNPFILNNDGKMKEYTKTILFHTALTEQYISDIKEFFLLEIKEYPILIELINELLENYKKVGE